MRAGGWALRCARMVKWPRVPDMPNTLFTNASVILDAFAELQGSYDVLVKGNVIHSVSSRPIDHGDATVIDVAGRTLMPGLIDAHAHITGLSLSPRNIAYPPSEIALAAAGYLRNSLMDGFTTIREAGGADHSIARLLAEGARAETVLLGACADPDGRGRGFSLSR